MIEKLREKLRKTQAKQSVFVNSNGYINAHNREATRYEYQELVRMASPIYEAIKLMETTNKEGVIK